MRKTHSDEVGRVAGGVQRGRQVVEPLRPDDWDTEDGGEDGREGTEWERRNWRIWKAQLVVWNVQLDSNEDARPKWEVRTPVVIFARGCAWRCARTNIMVCRCSVRCPSVECGGSARAAFWPAVHRRISVRPTSSASGRARQSRCVARARRSADGAPSGSRRGRRGTRPEFRGRWLRCRRPSPDW